MGNASQFSKPRAGTVAMERAADTDLADEAGTVTPELPRDVKFDLTSVPIVTWSYDPVTEEVRWSAPIEDLFGVDPGTPGFVLNMTADVDDLPAPLGRLGEQAGDGTDERRFGHLGRRSRHRHPRAHPDARSGPGRLRPSTTSAPSSPARRVPSTS